jgi:uncharacterized lipoprotein NlpE involved in copper resistance
MLRPAARLAPFFLPLFALAAAPARAEARSAIVIVVENNDEAKNGGKDGWLRVLDRFGEPVYAALLEAEARGGWDRVVLLSDEKASFAHFAATLRALDREGFAIDVVLDIHGSSSVTRFGNSTSQGPDRLYFSGEPATAADVAALGKPKKLRLNAVYMVSCWGSRFNRAWLEAGARAANGAEEINYYVLVSPLVFLREFAAGKDLETAAARAYEAEAALFERRGLDRALAPHYGARGVKRLRTAESSRRVQTGPSVRAAGIEGERARASALF